jgi:hypothetical protein
MSTNKQSALARISGRPNNGRTFGPVQSELEVIHKFWALSQILLFLDYNKSQNAQNLESNPLKLG